MIRCLSVFFFLLVFCFASGQSIQDVKLRVRNNYESAVKSLDAVTNQIVKASADDSAFVSALLQSHKSWEILVDSKVSMKYPYGPGGYGSSYGLCYYGFKTELVNRRIAELRPWIEGMEEGDICAGSVPNKVEVEPGNINKELDPALSQFVAGLRYVTSFKTSEVFVNLYSLVKSDLEIEDQDLVVAISGDEQMPYKMSTYSIKGIFKPEEFTFDGQNPSKPVLSFRFNNNGKMDLLSYEITLDGVNRRN